MSTKISKYVGTPAYEQGRAAMRGAIGRDEPPYAEDDDNLPAWQAGYDFERKALRLDDNG